MDLANVISSAAVPPAARSHGSGNGSKALVAPGAAEDLPRADACVDLAEMLRRSLDGARANLEIRERLQQLARDPARVEKIARTLGPRHAVIRELSRLRERSRSNPAA